jgi:hypothetical protein
LFAGKQRSGKIKVRLTHKVFQRQRQDDSSTVSNFETTSSIPLQSTHYVRTVDDKSFQWKCFFKSLVPRGLMLLGLAFLAVLKPSGNVPQLSISAVSGKTPLLSLPSRYSFHWSKLAESLSPLQSDGKSLATSLLSSMIIVWVPTLVVHGAWTELTLLGLSFVSNEYARGYFCGELWPAMLKTAQKLLWGEIWKHTWDFVLYPFPSNLLVPNRFSKKTTKETQQQSDSSNDDKSTPINFAETITGYASDFLHRLHVRVDKMTSMLLRKSIEGTVQSSLSEIMKDSWEAVTDVTANHYDLISDRASGNKGEGGEFLEITDGQ